MLKSSNAIDAKIFTTVFGGSPSIEFGTPTVGINAFTVANLPVKSTMWTLSFLNLFTANSGTYYSYF